MLKIRLQRVGRKNDASFRVVVIESQRGPKAGDALEVLGFYDPKKNITEIKGDRVTHWISVGAQASNTVHNILVKEKIVKGEKINVLPKKSPIKKEGESKEETKIEKKPESTDDETEASADAKSSGEVKEEKKQEETKEEKKSEPETSDTAKPSSAKSSGVAKEEPKTEEKPNDTNDTKEKKEEKKS